MLSSPRTSISQKSLNSLNGKRPQAARSQNSLSGSKKNLLFKESREDNLPNKKETELSKKTAGENAIVNQSNNLILFNISKREMFTPSNGFKSLQKRLKKIGKIGIYKEETINFAKLSEASLIIFGAPKEPFTSSEFTALKQYLERGGSILFLTGEGGDAQFNTNFNYLLEDYGMSVNSDAVTRTVYFKYFHPKEVYITNGVLNRELNKAGGKKVNNTEAQNNFLPPEQGKFNPSSLSFVYPFGATLNVQKPAIPIFSSGTASYPLNRPIGGVYLNPSGKGKLLVMGSVQMFGDQYIEKEENGKIFDVILQWLTTDKIVLNTIDSNEPDVSDYHYLPATAKLAESVRSCLQESEELPKDFTSMFELNLFKFDTSFISTSLNLYE
ncbi:Intraflagellar transport protein 52, partial [Clydaea vesicula]